MITDNYYKEVRFDLYCKTCKYVDLKDTDEPCNECLTEAINYASVKPVKYEEKKKKK